MLLGITSPIVTAVPGFHSPWERSAGIDDLSRIAEAADRLGFDHLTCSEHVAVPVEIAEQRGGTYWDPLATLSYLAARTTNIRLVTQVLVLGYHHPLAIAKRYGTLDLISNGRLVLGFGVGSIEEEFALLGGEFAGRGAIADDALAALRASMSQPLPSYDGPHFSYDGLVMDPHALQQEVPFWIGGYTPRSLRRARELGTGWVPFGLPHDQLRKMLDTATLPDGFEVVLGAGRPIDPIGEADRTRRAIDRTRDAGATVVNVQIAATSADHYVEQLEALAALEENR
ncbi:MULTISPECIES: TIGR03619 family F420-dependent LLM class oxidoreductase [unclassified Nocardioides]|uniref:TIGR03619 family F420-dependent LLM class oxidoreductase n=1 Tax=unclassified Nocardioides TaxID=2615069 RepID=UPI0006F3BF10|nr:MULTISPECIES: TIGR03619 family F420-dependent LLM class oxidoreductase [unclassified Nocardioides]KRA29520.1 LLM class F420-dependent oxidoreductase [Nocardioides sp. Root614]KRA88305.1 LLM class F420-dependent oxidoreductase [Nocardioides sp. Root682]